jgi:hypothetical protein
VRTGPARTGSPVEHPVEGAGEVHASTLPGGQVAATWHVGPYEQPYRTS